MNMENLSAIIPIHKKYNLSNLIKSIEDLVKEIIIINSSKEIFEFEDPKIKVFNSQKKLNASEARNLGIEKSSNEVLFFLDCDVSLTSKGINFIKQLNDISDKEMIGGIYSLDENGTLISNINTSIIRHRFLKNNKTNMDPEFISSSHFLIRKTTMQQIGGFNEQLNSWEDVDLSFRSKIFDIGMRIESDFEAVHHKNYNFMSHFYEHIKKTYYASKIKISNYNLYKGAQGQLPFKILLYLAPLPISLLLFYFGNKFSALFIFLGILSIITFVNKSIYLNFFSSLISSIYMSISTPFFLISNMLGKFQFFIEKTLIFTLELYDYAICGLKVLLKNGNPIQYIQYVTARCNLRCDHCFYKETLDKKDAGEISKDLLISTAKDMSPMLWYSIAGGEPFIRKDLGHIISEIQQKSRPKILSLPTNGWYTRKTFNTVLEVMQKTNRGKFLVFFSIDGRNKVHDNIRGDNSYEKLKQTYEVLRKLKKIYPRLHLCIIITVQDKNYHLFPNIIDEIYEEFDPTSISINLLRYHYKNAEKLDPKIIDGYKKAIQGYEKLRNKNGYGLFWNAIIKAKEKVQKDLILKVALKDEFVTPCTAGNLSYVGMEDGSIKPCEILPDTVGNIYKDKIKNIYNNKKSKSLRNEIVKSKCRCTYECAMSTNSLFNFDQQKILLKQTLKDIL